MKNASAGVPTTLTGTGAAVRLLTSPKTVSLGATHFCFWIGSITSPPFVGIEKQSQKADRASFKSQFAGAQPQGQIDYREQVK
jgi:hypothetical protein